MFPPNYVGPLWQSDQSPRRPGSCRSGCCSCAGKGGLESGSGFAKRSLCNACWETSSVRHGGRWWPARATVNLGAEPSDVDGLALCRQQLIPHPHFQPPSHAQQQHSQNNNAETGNTRDIFLIFPLWYTCPKLRQAVYRALKSARPRFKACFWWLPPCDLEQFSFILSPSSSSVGQCIQITWLRCGSDEMHLSRETVSVAEPVLIIDLAGDV